MGSGPVGAGSSWLRRGIGRHGAGPRVGRAAEGVEMSEQELRSLAETKESAAAVISELARSHLGGAVRLPCAPGLSTRTEGSAGLGPAQMLRPPTIAQHDGRFS